MTDKECNRSAGASAGEMIFHNDGIYVVDEDGTRTRIAPPILVPSYATSNPNTARESAFTVINFF